MCRLVIVAGFLLLPLFAVAQAPHPNITLADSIVYADPEWVDLDNDALLDVLLFMKSKSNKSYIGIIKGDSVQPLSQISKIFLIPSHRAHLITDYNRDNAMDIIVSGEENQDAITVAYINKGSFTFEEKSLTLPPFTNGRFADLDDDATPELIVTGEVNGSFYTKILKQISENSWLTIHDSLKIQCSAIETLDADGDGDMDLFLSGQIESDSLFSGVLINKRNFYFEPKYSTALEGSTAVGDFNNDGFFEILLMGENKNGEWVSKMYEKSGQDYAIKDVSVKLRNGKPFIADFDYDGFVDVNYYGIGANDTLNYIKYHTGDVVQLPKDNIAGYRFGDMKHDGNLDLLTVYHGETLSVVLSPLLPQKKNLAPGSPLNAVALPVFNHVFMYWDKPADDHTPQKSLTYDIFLEGVQSYKTGEFDLSNDKRLTVTHGNNGTENFKLLKRVSYEGLRFSLQAVDNSFHAGHVCLGGPGSGSAPCATVATETISACSNENVALTSPPNALWFSFADGFLGIRGDFEFASDAGDTLFYYNPMGEGCSSLKAWAIQIKDDTLKVETTEKYVCEDATLQFSVEPGWENIHWESNKKGDLGSTEIITYQASEADSLIVTLSNSKGCTIIRKTALKLSSPDVQVSPDHFKVMKGGKVHLVASGAQRYTWTPPSGLSQADIPNPIATPSSTIRYTVTGFDSLGCTRTAELTIEVEDTGFIPTLFSPNDDGQNDELKIYGVASAQRFSFSIYDRDGALVYRTSNVSEAVQHGWDGTKNGAKQPPGVYFWKVKGQLVSGPLLLNGKDSGSIVLIR